MSFGGPLIGAAFKTLKLQGFPADNRVMTTDNTHDLVGTLNKRAQEAATATRQPDYRARALEAAFAQGSEDRAWACVRLAADLRADNENAAALSVLDDAWLLGPSEEAERAIYTVAIAVHCDLGSHPTAEVIEREQAARSVDGHFARAAARLYAELARSTGDDEHSERRQHYSEMVSEGPETNPAVAA